MNDVTYDILYTPSFLRSFKKSDPHLQEEIEETINKLRNSSHHQVLRVHKLTGKLKDFHSCSVNYSHRIVFELRKKHVIVLLAVGNHDVYQ